MFLIYNAIILIDKKKNTTKHTNVRKHKKLTNTIKQMFGIKELNANTKIVVVLVLIK